MQAIGGVDIDGTYYRIVIADGAVEAFGKRRESVVRLDGGQILLAGELTEAQRICAAARAVSLLWATISERRATEPVICDAG